MSEELKRKLYNYEVEPPEVIWRRVAAALDQEINAEFPQKLYALEETPPTAVWNKIEQQLKNDDKEQYPAKLYDIEVAPPAESWNKISDALNEERTPLRNASKARVVSFVRYAVAACIV